MLAGTSLGASLPPIQTVFLILMENHDWTDLKDSPDAPYLNNLLLPMAAHCEQYHNPPGVHPSLPNYLWLEAGTNFGIYDDLPPASNHQPTTDHLATLLDNANVPWKAYQEDISGTCVPLSDTNAYAVRHNPFVCFDDVTGTNDPSHPYGIAHSRPYSEFAADLTNNTVARYNFITPNLCNDTHDSCAPLFNPVRQGDNWLAAEVPKILNSTAYQNSGALFITWDESTTGDGPIGLIVDSPLARGGGYANSFYYTHSSTLRTVQEIFGVTPLLGDAANARDLSDFFPIYGFSAAVNVPGVGIQLTAVSVIPGSTNVIEASFDLTLWTAISTNIVATNTFTFTDTAATNYDARFYRLVQSP
jgi:hypothetical protein